MLRLTAVAERIVHIPKILYYWRSHPQSVAQDISAKTYAITAGRKAVQDSIARSGYQAEVDSSEAFPTIYRIKYKLVGTPKVSILIVNDGSLTNISRCVKSIQEKTTYQNYEIVIVDCEKASAKTLAYYETLQKEPNIKLYIQQSESFSVGNNFAAEKANGDYYLFLHSDTQILTPDWIEEMLMYAQRRDVAAVGAKLYYSDNTVQHAGLILGVGSEGVAEHIFRMFPKSYAGYMGRLRYSQNMSAVSCACMLVKTSVFDEIGGFDETYKVAHSDVDLCMRMRDEGYLIVWTPYAELYHYERKKRISIMAGNDKKRQTDTVRFKDHWAKELEAGDPYFNPNCTLNSSDYL